MTLPTFSCFQLFSCQQILFSYTANKKVERRSHSLKEQDTHVWATLARNISIFLATNHYYVLCRPHRHFDENPSSPIIVAITVLRATQGNIRMCCIALLVALARVSNLLGEQTSFRFISSGTVLKIHRPRDAMLSYRNANGTRSRRCFSRRIIMRTARHVEKEGAVGDGFAQKPVIENARLLTIRRAVCKYYMHNRALHSSRIRHYWRAVLILLFAILCAPNTLLIS